MGVRARNPIERDLETFHPSSFGWALHYCRWNREEAEEVLQTSYLKAIDDVGIDASARERLAGIALSSRRFETWLDYALWPGLVGAWQTIFAALAQQFERSAHTGNSSIRGDDTERTVRFP